MLCYCHHHHHHPFHVVTSQFCKERSCFSFCLWEEGKTQDPSSRKICKLSSELFRPLSTSFSQPLRTPFPCSPTQQPPAALLLSRISPPILPKQLELQNYLSHFFSFQYFFFFKRETEHMHACARTQVGGGEAGAEGKGEKDSQAGSMLCAEPKQGSIPQS